MTNNVMQDVVEPFTAEVRANFDGPEHIHRNGANKDKMAAQALPRRFITDIILM